MKKLATLLLLTACGSEPSAPTTSALHGDAIADTREPLRVVAVERDPTIEVDAGAPPEDAAPLASCTYVNAPTGCYVCNDPTAEPTGCAPPRVTTAGDAGEWIICCAVPE